MNKTTAFLKPSVLMFIKSENLQQVSISPQDRAPPNDDERSGREAAGGREADVRCENPGSDRQTVNVAHLKNL